MAHCDDTRRCHDLLLCAESAKQAGSATTQQHVRALPWQNDRNRSNPTDPLSMHHLDIAQAFKQRTTRH
eukprot:14311590-Alexandrium_andersonii.AAC.1